MNTTSKTIVAETITSAELAQLEVRRYEGPVCLVSTPEELARAAHEIRREQVVGMDTETQPTFHKGQVHLPTLVQVATARAVYLFQLKRMDFTGLLKELLESPSIAKTGIGLSHDFAKLKHRFPFEEQNVVDLSAIARSQGMKQTGVRNLAALFLGFRVPKGQSTTNWARAELTRNQIIYAATDAWVCRELHLCFQERGFLG